MKANELMIWDICKFSKGKYPYKRGEVYVIKRPECIHLHDRLEGIPLTTEILEKNGFVQDDSYSEYIAETYSEEFLIWHYYADELMISYDASEELVISYNLGHPCKEINLYRPYVHELQHALRLCGLNDLADNFKV